ncbi:hypothetical protein B0J13DRAFT_646060 [Dactylonectria estremocensis]|uniref:GS catalytic domain-containing protein n=1 Tax=Dactylonectria estremocensis TaxID=1079267 RepID=A0A9P9DZ74_9HYPO|nr:hypothetical protein B0J13DRAFT_646060 [Dactylonectria estremocensis]
MANTREASLVFVFFGQNPSCQYIRYQWVDYSGILRARILTKDHCLELAARREPLRCSDICFQCLPNNVALEVSAGVNHLLYPDWNSLRVLQPSGSRLSYATVMCFIEGASFKDTANNFNLCPRLSLERMLNKAKDHHGIQLLLGFEIEFYVLDRDFSGAFVPAMKDAHVEEVVSQLRKLGIQFQGCHIEGAHGQYEIVMHPLPPMQAIDELLIAQDIIKTTFERVNLTATMAPRPLKDRSSCGLHAHISIDAREHNNSFLAGILARLPELCAITMPYPQSYSRVRQYEAGNKVCWGTENKKTPVRRVKDGHWEFRCLDATANPYLAISAIIAAGLKGVDDNMDLSWEDMSHYGSESPAWTAAEDLLAQLDQSFGALKGRLYEWGEMLQSDILDWYTRLKEQEVNALQNLSATELRELMLKWF